MNPPSKNWNLSRAIGVAPVNGNLHLLAVQGFVGLAAANGSLNYFIMPNPHLKTPVERLPEDVQEYIQFLEQRNSLLLGLLDPDYYDYTQLMEILGSSMLNYMNSRLFRENGNSEKRGEVICYFFESLSEAIQQLAPEQDC